MIGSGKGQEEGGSGSEKVGHLLFHEAATALRVSVWVCPPGPVPTLVSTLSCAALLHGSVWN